MQPLIVMGERQSVTKENSGSQIDKEMLCITRVPHPMNTKGNLGILETSGHEGERYYTGSTKQCDWLGMERMN